MYGLDCTYHRKRNCDRIICYFMASYENDLLCNLWQGILLQKYRYDLYQIQTGII